MNYIGSSAGAVQGPVVGHRLVLGGGLDRQDEAGQGAKGVEEAEVALAGGAGEGLHEVAGVELGEELAEAHLGRTDLLDAARIAEVALTLVGELPVEARA